MNTVIYGDSRIWRCTGPSARSAPPQSTQGSSFQAMISQASGAGAEPAADSCVEAYKRHLDSRYGKVTVQSVVSRDQKTLDGIGGAMSGNDVIIAPNILQQMAGDPEKALYYERKIDDFFEATPRLSSYFAAQGLTYEPCGVVIHPDGCVTYICGGGDSPERVAEVNRINREKQAKKAAQQQLWAEQSQQAALRRKEWMQQYLRTQLITGGSLNNLWLTSGTAGAGTLFPSASLLMGGIML